jgi:predicted RNA binding protein YcfA (HicA-like mRNA interferase family)
VTARDLVAYAKSKGWRFVRRGGQSSHLIFAHPNRRYKLSIPDHGYKDIARGTLARMVKQIEGTWRKEH